ncbi:MAG: D-glycero-beta-D-manno-heptose-7-phosphate kinase [Candidatus Krumholzibacteria bacterium]|nr:D-glycero-beta-D-manno-heptose-7-phosphate kinase [Candidatus Krumholzibacteria bacterium]
MRRRRAAEILKAVKGTPVAVVGDLMLDRYFWGNVERISPEAPVPVVGVASTNVRPGGAANVAWNLMSLGCDVRLVGICGRDHQGRELRRLLGERGIADRFVVADGRRVTTEKIRIIAHNQQVVRADFETNAEVAGPVLGRLRSALGDAVEGCGAVVVSDYGKGVVSMPVMDDLRRLCADAAPVLIDPKEGHFDLYRGAWCVTPNLKEAAGFYNTKIRGAADLEWVGRALLRDLGARAVLITRGEEGMTLFEEGRLSHHLPTRAREVYDVTGAGDTVISVLAAAVAAGAGLREAIELANAAAGIVIRELGTAAAKPEEMADAFGI